MNQIHRLFDLKFFIVDDDPFCLTLYRQHLTNLGFHDYRLFENGLDCIANLYQQPDVIFIDYDMRPCNGIEVLNVIKKINANIYVVIISSKREFLSSDNTLTSGAFQYIGKGESDLEQISSTIDNVVALRSSKMKISV